MASKRQTAMRIVRTLRLVASFALLGAVLTGVGFGWMEQLPFDPRAVGASLGALGGVALAIYKVAHFV